jgi:hypothetical protein
VYIEKTLKLIAITLERGNNIRSVLSEKALVDRIKDKNGYGNRQGN